MKFNDYFKLRDVTINVTNNCNLRCPYCVSGDTQITMGDLTTKSIKDIKLGDKVVAFNEFSEKNKQRKLKTSEVIHVFEPRYVEKLYQIETNSGNKLFITDEHPLLDGRNKWTTAEKLIDKTERKLKVVELPVFSICNEFTNDYKIGYIISCFLGDGSIKKYIVKNIKNNKEYDGYRIRFVVKDDDINQQLKQFLIDVGISFNERDYTISKKFNIKKSGIFSNKYDTFYKLNILIQNNLNINQNDDYLKGFLAGIYDCEGSYGKDKQLKICNGNPEIIQQIKTALEHFGYEYNIKEKSTKVNVQVYDFRIMKKSINDFLMNVYPACFRKRVKYENYSPIYIDKIKSIKEIEFNDYVYNIETTEHTYIANNVLVHNCFENNKNELKMNEDTIKKVIDKCYENYLLTNDAKFPFVVNFFGGEPFLNFSVIETAMKYAKEKGYNITFGVTTNLTILDDHMIDIIEEYELGILVSIDGIRAIHNRNRCNSYDKVKENVEKLMGRHLGYLLEARMTILPEDVDRLLESIQSIVDMGIVNIAPVPVTDVIWSPNQLLDLERNLNKVWDWLFDIYNNEENKKNISIKFIEDYIENVLMVPLNEYQTKVCSAGTFTSCSIGVTGDILPCHQRHSVSYRYKDLVMGNILENTDIKEVEFNNGTIKGAFNCDECIAKSVCKGGCPSENYTKNGNGNIMNEVQCMVNMIMVSVACDHQLDLLHCSNVRSHRLNVLSQNLSLLAFLFEEVLTKSPDSQEYAMNLLYFYEKIIDMEDIILPNFNEVFKKVIERLVNINKENIKLNKGENNEH